VDGTSIGGKDGKYGRGREIYAPWRDPSNQPKTVNGTRMADRVAFRLAQSKCTMQNWLPHYWWTYYDPYAMNTSAITFFSTFDDRLIPMLPFWMQTLLVISN
jgi:hypothetical protein